MDPKDRGGREAILGWIPILLRVPIEGVCEGFVLLLNLTRCGAATDGVHDHKRGLVLLDPLPEFHGVINLPPTFDDEPRMIFGDINFVIDQVFLQL